MRFALLGDHRDGLDFAIALTASGRHEVTLYSGPASGLTRLNRIGIMPRAVSDPEEILGDPHLDAVIVASGPSVRPAHLRRALQSECHVLCVHPADAAPDVAYESALIQADTGRVLLPLLPIALHPGIARAARMARIEPLPRLVELEMWAVEEVLFADDAEEKAGLPGWDALRAVGGEIAEIIVQSGEAELTLGQPVLVSGRFLSGLLFQAVYLPDQSEARWRMSLVTTTGRATLLFPNGCPGPAQWDDADERGQARMEIYDAFDPYSALLARFEEAVAAAAARKPMPGQPSSECLTQTPATLGWQDELRALELDDAARRSAARGKSSTLDLQETTEEAAFKGTMTLVGCSLIWMTIVVLILSFWMPWLAWFILPLFAVFLGLQALRWALPQQSSNG